MATTNFAVPIVAGKTEAWKAACVEIAGARKEEYLASRRALGITKEVACLQETPHGDYVVVHIEAGDVSGIMQGMMDATDSFSNWFKEAIFKDVHGIDGTGPVPPAPRSSWTFFRTPTPEFPRRGKPRGMDQPGAFLWLDMPRGNPLLP